MNPFRKISRVLKDSIEAYQWALIDVQTGDDVLADLETRKLITPEHQVTVEISAEPTIKEIRRSLWELRKRKEWKADSGVLWAAPTDNGYTFGMGRLLQQDEPDPVAVPHVVVTADA